MIARDSRIDNVLSAVVNDDAVRQVPGDVDIWPQVQAKLARRGKRRFRRFALILAAATLLFSASVALADAPPVRLVVMALDPARVRIGALPEPSVRMSLAEAENKAGVTALRAPEGSSTRLVSVELVAPVTEILGRPVVNPQPRIRLTYDIGGATAIVEQQRNPRPGEPMLIVHLGGGDTGRPETDGSIERFYFHNSSTDRVDGVAWGTQELWIRVRFEPGTSTDQARLFVGSLR
jgi:hypothetical protein